MKTGRICCGLRKYWRKAISLVLLVAMIGSGGLSFQVSEALAADTPPPYIWYQTDWSGQADTVNFPDHPDNQTGWTRFYSKDAGIVAGAELTLAPTTIDPTTGYITHTTDDDFRAGILAYTTVSGAGTDAVVELSTGDIADLQVAPIGERSFDRFGRSVSSAGDVNNDGYADVIVGAPRNNAGGIDAGRAYIFFGGPAMDSTADLTLTGEAANDRFGHIVSSAGDVNNDGYADVIVGAPRNDAGGIDAGRAYIFFGGPVMDSTADVTLTGEAAYDRFGHSVSSAGDINKDGYADVIVGVGSTGGNNAYIYFGGPAMDSIADVTLTGEATYDSFGWSVSSAGDVNNDGFADVIVGAPLNNAGGIINAGSAYIYFGGTAMDSTADIILTGESRGEEFGRSVSSAGDVNNDGYADVIVAIRPDYFGRVYIYFGGPAMDSTADVTLIIIEAHNAFGWSVSSAGDVNNDGFADVIVGAHINDAGGYNTGGAYIFFGGTAMDSRPDITLAGEKSHDRFGYSVSSAGDVNDDGYADVIVGAQFNDEGGGRAGKAYIYTIAPGFPSVGTFISSAIDAGQNSDFTTLDFSIVTPTITGLRFQLRTATTEAGLGAAVWHGPTGTADYYTTAGTAINPVHDGNRWIQYKAFFSTDDPSVTPALQDITINYQFYPVSLTQTTDVHFRVGTLDDTIVFGTGVPAEVRLASTPGFANRVIIDGAFDCAYSVFAADLDGDGDQDILGADGDDGIVWWQNDGVGNFTRNVIDGGFSGTKPSVFAIDFDRDGNQDVLAAASGWYDGIAWWRNDGYGNFTRNNIDRHFECARSVFAADLDGDFDLDVLGAGGGGIAWWRNDGTDGFTRSVIRRGCAYSVFATDLDGDGDQDVLGATRNGFFWWENDGQGDFTRSRMPQGTGCAYSVFASDLDGDGDQDVLGAARGRGIIWWRNDGVGGFSSRKTIDGAFDCAYSVFAADLDGDGDQDVLGSDGCDGIAWWQNDGVGGFSARKTIDGAFDCAYSVFAADLDGDGDQDVLGAARDYGIAWWRNDHVYRSSGTFISSAIDSGKEVDFTTLDFTISEPAGTDLKFQLRTAANEYGLAYATWYGPTGTGDFYTDTGTAINHVHDGHRWIQYKGFFSTDNNNDNNDNNDPSVTPALQDITINFQLSASLISSPFNTGNPQKALVGINWSETVPAGTEIKFQLRTSPDNAAWTAWMGPDGTADTFFIDHTGGEAIPDALSDGINDRWVQYRVWLKTTDSSVTPTLEDVTLSYRDVVPPAAPTDVAVTNGVINIANEDAVVLTGNAEPGSTVEVSLTDNVTTITATGTANDVTGAFSITVDATGLDDRLISVDARATDGAGNIGPWSAAITVTKDTAAPTVAINDVTTPTNVATQTLTGTMEYGATVTLSSGTATFGDVTPTGTTWSVVAILAPRANTITATATDAAGNTATAIVEGGIELFPTIRTFIHR